MPMTDRDAAVDRVCAELKPSAKKMVKEVLMLNDVPADLSWDGYLIVEQWVDAAVRAAVEQAMMRVEADTLRAVFCERHYDRYAAVKLPMRYCRHDGCADSFTVLERQRGAQG